MSISNDIKILLDIQDENIHFQENAIEYKEFRGKTAKFITGLLTYTPSYCECCGVKNENYTVFNIPKNIALYKNRRFHRIRENSKQ